jgi:hypothetical protein
MTRLVSMRMLLVALLAGCVGLAMAQEQGETVLSADFEREGPETIASPEIASKVLVTTDPADVVAGNRSLKGDSRTSGAQWNEYFRSRAGLFKPNEGYVVSFDYRVLAREPRATFYLLFRQPGGTGNVGWVDWKGEPGEKGHIDATLAASKTPDFALILGIQWRGALAIDNLVIKTDPQQRPEGDKLPAPERTWKSPGNCAYYVDSQAGNDAADGRSEQTAWKSLDRVNAGEFGPGDRILLRAGSQWSGYLAPGGSGQEGAPICLDRYGDGPKPQINGQGKTLTTLLLLNVQHWEVSNLDITNTGTRRQPGRTGVLVKLQDSGVAEHIRLRGLDVHDVNGSLVKSQGGGSGIHCASSGATVKSRFDDLLIEGCHLQRTDRNGITMNGSWARRDWFPSTRVVIRGNLLEDIGGDGIVPIACDGALVERNLLRGGRQRCRDAAAGIWPWSCDNTVIQFNEVSGMKGTVDGQGYDSDWNCQNTLFQYNYSHDNEGGFMLVCNNGSSTMPYSIGNIGTVIRYNVSQNDGCRTFHITGPCKDTKIYNNTIYIGKTLDIPILRPGNWGGSFSDNTLFANNLFLVDGKASFDLGGMTGTVFEANAFYGEIAQRPEDARAILADPLLQAAGTGADGFASLEGYKLREGSPCLGAGRVIPGNGGRDFWGNPVPAGTGPDVGACQSSAGR